MSISNLKFRNGSTWENIVVPIANGGTGATTAEAARDNLSIFRNLGTNITGGVANDTNTFWASKEPGVYYFSEKDMIKDQPSQYGFLINIKTSSTSALSMQIWSAYSTGQLYVRGLNTSGNVQSTWKKLVMSTVPVADGGTGADTLTAHGVLVGNGTSAVKSIGGASSGAVYKSSTAGDPAIGTLPVNMGGTGTTTHTAHGIIVGNGTSAVKTVGGGSTGAVYKSAATSDPSVGTLPVSMGGTGATSLTQGGYCIVSTSTGHIGSYLPGKSRFMITNDDGTSYASLAAIENTKCIPGWNVEGKWARYSLPWGPANGGTGTTSLTAHGILVGNGTSEIKSVGGDKTGAAYKSSATGDPTFGTLPVSMGGTGRTSWGENGVVATNSTGALTYYTRTNAGLMGWNASGAPGTYAIPLSIANGGTGRTSITANSLLYGNSAGNIVCSTRTSKGFLGWNQDGEPGQYGLPLSVANGGTGVTDTAKIGLYAYPVGSVYIAYNSTSPGQRFGGTWERIYSKVLRANDNGTTGNDAVSTGGKDTRQLTVAQMPSHTHKVVYKDNEAETVRRHLLAGKAGNYSEPIRGDNAALPTSELMAAATGGGESFSNLPAYQNLFVWRRTA